MHYGSVGVVLGWGTHKMEFSLFSFSFWLSDDMTKHSQHRGQKGGSCIRGKRKEKESRWCFVFCICMLDVFASWVPRLHGAVRLGGGHINLYLYHRRDECSHGVLPVLFYVF